jgi:polyisoprenoid-binding protein YceI
MLIYPGHIPMQGHLMTSSTLSSTATALPAGTWHADHTHSFAGFAVRAVGTFRGSFDAVSASLAVGEDGSAELAGSVVADSIQVKDNRLKAHLSSADFFDMGNHPELRFSSTSLSRNGAEVTLVGDLTIRGHTQPVEARGTISEPVTALDGAVRFGLSFETVIDRTDYGVAWNVPMPAGGKVLGDEVTITLDLDLVRAGVPND